MDKEVECGVKLRLDIFNTYWNILKRNYQDTQHTEEDYKIYYSIFREYEEKDFIKAVKLVLKYQSFFPRINEIVKFLPKIDDVNLENENIPKWMNQTLNPIEPSEEEKKNIEGIISGLVDEK
ncbi:MAG: hypothetical protein Q4E39_06120 [bacterium]|nr:hypothetical protein [bacterium]